MKFKREIMIIILIIAMLFTVSSVCAVDSEIQAISAHNSTDELVSAVNDDNLGMNDDVEILAETDDGSFAALNTKISGVAADSTIDLWNNYVYGENDVITAGIDIDTSGLTIDGHGFTIDAKFKTNIFNVNTGQVTIKNITFKNANGQYGGAIDTNSPQDLTVNNCTFINNYGSVGAIYFYKGSNANIVNCTFNRNHGDYSGGVYLSQTPNSNIINCTFIDNEGSVGAINMYYTSNANIVNCTFKSNSGTNVGAIKKQYYSGDIKNSIFINNIGEKAGSIYWISYSGNGNISNNIFLKNTGDNDVFWDNTYGSQVYADYNWWGQKTDDYLVSSPDVNSAFTLNNYHVLDLNLDDENNLATVSLNNLYANGVLDKSNTIYNLPSINLTVKSDEFNINKDITLDNKGKATFEYDSSFDGYSITVSYESINLFAIISYPSLTKLDSVINVDPNIDEIYLDYDYEYNSDRDNGFVGINIDRTLTIDGQGHYIDAKNQKSLFNFNGNNKNFILKNIRFLNANGANGAAVYFNGNKIEIINCTFEGNTASSNGDAVYVADINEASKIDQCSFIDNKGTFATVYINSGDVEFDITNSIFLNNSGLNVKAEGTNVAAQYNWFGHNTDNYDDGSVAKVEGVLLSNNLYLNIVSSGNVATVSLNNLNGGTYNSYSLPTIELNVDNVNLTVDDSVIIGETGVAELSYDLSYYTGSITVGYDSDSSYTKELEFVDDGTFTALQKIISFAPESSTLNLERDYIYNPATDSALTTGITISKPITINGKNHKIDAQKSIRIFVVEQDATFGLIKFVNGKVASGKGGGVIYNQGGACAFYKCSFINNVAGSGGVLYNSKSNVNNQFHLCIFENNSATNGGVIYEGLVHCNDCIFINNSATSAGGVYRSEYSGNDYYDNCTFINNSANMGAAIYNGGSSNQGSIVDSRFIGNKIIGSNNNPTSSIIYTSANWISCCIFINNTINSQNAAVLYANKYDGYTTVINSIFLNNRASKNLHTQLSKCLVANYNWFGNTYDNFDNETVTNISSNVVLDNWLYLDASLRTNHADISLKLYEKSTPQIIYTYSTPEITLNINSTTLDLEKDTVTLDSTGKGRVDYTMDSESAALTMNYENVELTKAFIVGDFDVLQDIIDGEDTLVELDRDYTYIIGGDSITSGIAINKNIIIDGKGKKLDAKEKTRFFDVQGGEVTFKNITFVNGKAGDGAAITINSNGGKVNIINCTFSECVASGKGGAIYLNTKDSEFSLYNSSFTKLQANNGGALYIQADNSDVTVDKCLFRENKETGGVNSENYGSAIYWETINDDEKDNVVKNSIFLDNIGDGLNKYNTNAFSYISGNVNINENWWGTTAQNSPYEFYEYYTGHKIPTSWLYIDGEKNSSSVYVNEPVAVKFILKLYDQSLGICDYDNTKLPCLNLTVSSDAGTVDKTFASFNETIIYNPTAVSTQGVVKALNINTKEFEYKFVNRDYSILTFLVDNPCTMYCGQGFSFSGVAKYSDRIKSFINVETSDSSIVALKGGLGNDNDINVKGKTGTAVLTFSYDGIYKDLYDVTSEELVINVFKIPLEIVVTNIESDEISIYATQTIYLNITLVVDDIHESYGRAQWSKLECSAKNDHQAGNVLYSKSNSGTYTGASVNGTYECRGSMSGSSNLTFYYTDNDYYSFENVTIRFTVLKIPTEIILDHADNLELKVGDNSKINATLINGTNLYTLKYTSSDSNIVSVDNTGQLEAVGEGTAVITVKYDGNTQREEYTKEVTVTVTKYSTTTEFSNHDAIELKVNGQSQVTATLTAEDGADIGNPTYESSDEAVVSVDSMTGEITAVSEGTATITAKYDGTTSARYDSSSDTVQVTVTRTETSIVLTSSSEVTLDVFGSSEIIASLTPSTAGALSYKSSNSDVATVDSNGIITAKAGGVANITIYYAGNNAYAPAEDVNVTVTVNKLPTTITVDSTNNVDVFDSKSLGATLNHEGTLLYESFNPEIVTVDENGVIAGVIGGTGVISISFEENGQYLGKTTTVTVTVNKIASSITADPIEINVFDSQLINPTIVGDGVVNYVSCDPSIVTVNLTTGKITGVKGGKTNVTIKLAEGAKYLAKDVNVTVTVNKLPTEITVDSTITVDVDGTNTIQACTDNGRALKYESLNPDIVTVDENTGVITGVIGGTGEIKISFIEDDQYLEKTATVTVTVNKLNPTITVDPIEIEVFESKLINPTVVSDGTVTYESCVSSIVTVDENTGEITGVIGGVANVTIKVAETQRYLAGEANVTVVVNKVATIITVDSTMRLKMGDSKNIVATVVSGADIHYQTASDIITVDEDTGLVTAIKGGIAEVTVSVDATDKYKANFTVVTVTVARLPDDDTPIELTVFSQADVSALYNFGGDPANLKYLSSNNTVFTVTDAGILDALAGGEANLTIKDEILGESVTIKVIINKLETPIVAQAVSIDVYQSINLPVNIPQKANITQLIYESSNPDVVTVDENGVITGVIGGTATITVRYVEDGQFVENSTDVVVTVNKLHSTIDINESEFSIYVSGKDVINATTNNEGGLLYASNSPCISLATNVVTGVAEGTVEIKVIALENDKYLAKTEIVKVTVNKIPSTITVASDEYTIDVDGNASFEAILNHEGDLTYKYDESIINVENGVIYGLIGGKTNITISYAGDGKYAAAEDVNVTVTVNKLPTAIIVNSTIEVDVDGTNTIVATADGRTLEFISLDESIVTVDKDTGVITGVKGGVANVTVRFTENDRYLGDEVNVTVTVNKLTSTITADPIDITVFESQLINPTIVSDGAVSYVSCDPAIVTVNATNGNITCIKGGKANITIKVAEGDKYLANEFNVTVTVNKIPTTIVVNPTISVDYGKTSNIVATADNDGTLIFTSINPDIVTVDENGLITAVKRGVTNVTVKFEENETHEGSEVNVTVTVNGLSIDLIIDDADDVTVGGTSTIKFSLTESDATGFVIVNVNGTEYPVNISETQSLDVVLDNVGSYDVYAVYQGNEKYQTAESNAVTIKASPKHDNTISVNVTQDIRTGDKVEINVTSGGDAIDVYVDGVKQTVNDGKVVIDSLSVGQHTIKVVSNETAEYAANSTEFTIDVDKKQADITISVLGDLVVDEWINININYNGSNLVVYMDGKVIDDYEDSFKAIAGNHLIVASVSDDDEYYGTTETYNFTVSKKDSEVYVSATPNPVTVGGNTIIEVDIQSDATGIVIIDLNGTKYSLNITESKSLSIVLDKVGSYNLSAQYLGDERYLPSEVYVGTPIETEDKQISEIDISIPDVIYAGDNVEIAVTAGNDNLEVYLDDELKTLTDNKLTVENITAGTHLIKVVSPETAELKYNSTTVIINANKKESSVSIKIPETINIGDDVVINVTSTSDADIEVYVDGVRQTLIDGKVTVKATAGVHNIVASVGESDKFLPSGANESFKVDKLDAPISVSATNITEGQNTTVTIETEINEGIVLIKINDTEVAVDLAKAKSADVLLAAPGNYELSATYLGSDIYNAAEALKSTINVAKKQTPPVNVTIPEIKANETEPVSISIPNATGEVHVIVDGVDETVTLDENGNATYTLPKMSAGSHSVVIVYPGDEKNVPVIKSVPITVTKQTSQANITPPEDVKEGDDASVKVEIANATGEVIIIVDGIEHKVPLENGTVDYPLNNLSGGNHSVVVIYPGDEAHDASYSASSFNVEVEPVVVKVATEFKNITIDKDLNITVNLVDVNGNPIENAEIIYKIGDEAKSIYTAADGSFTIKGVAKAEVVIEYMGNETFLATNTSLTLENAVPETKLATHFNITEGTTIETYAIERGAGEVGSLYAFKLTDSEGNPLVNASIKFAYKDVIFYGTTNEQGIVYLGVSTYVSQDALCALSYLGDDKHNATFVAFNFKIKQKPTAIKAYQNTFKAAKKNKYYTVTLKTIVGASRDGKVYLGEGKKLTLKINGRTFTAYTNAKGQATFKITNLKKKGKYVAVVKFAGKDPYASSSKKVVIKVK